MYLTPEMRRTLPSAVQKRIKRENQRAAAMRNADTETPAQAWRRVLAGIKGAAPFSVGAITAGKGARLWIQKQARKRRSLYVAKGGVRK